MGLRPSPTPTGHVGVQTGWVPLRWGRGGARRGPVGRGWGQPGRMPFAGLGVGARAAGPRRAVFPGQHRREATTCAGQGWRSDYSHGGTGRRTRPRPASPRSQGPRWGPTARRLSQWFPRGRGVREGRQRVPAQRDEGHTQDTRRDGAPRAPGTSPSSHSTRQRAFLSLLRVPRKPCAPRVGRAGDRRDGAPDAPQGEHGRGRRRRQGDGLQPVPQDLPTETGVAGRGSCHGVSLPGSRPRGPRAGALSDRR